MFRRWTENLRLMSMCVWCCILFTPRSLYVVYPQCTHVMCAPDWIWMYMSDKHKYVYLFYLFLHSMQINRIGTGILYSILSILIHFHSQNRQCICFRIREMNTIREMIRLACVAEKGHRLSCGVCLKTNM